jgi:hypothetical protein
MAAQSSAISGIDSLIQAGGHRQDCPWCRSPDAARLHRPPETDWQCSYCGAFTFMADGEALFHSWLGLDAYGWAALQARMADLLRRSHGRILIDRDLMVRVRYGVHRSR